MVCFSILSTDVLIQLIPPIAQVNLPHTLAYLESVHRQPPAPQACCSFLCQSLRVWHKSCQACVCAHMVVLVLVLCAPCTTSGQHWCHVKTGTTSGPTQSRSCQDVPTSEDDRSTSSRGLCNLVGRQFRIGPIEFKPAKAFLSNSTLFWLYLVRLSSKSFLIVSICFVMAFCECQATKLQRCADRLC